MTQIVKIDPKEFGLEESKAADIAAQFKPMLDRMVELEAEFNQVVKLDIEDPKTASAAKALRLKYVKVRTGTADIHKAQKAFYLAGGRFVDGWKNAQVFASQGIEEKLESIEKHFERKEADRIAKLQSEREAELIPFEVENLQTLNLGQMSDSVWTAFLSGTKSAYEAKKEAEAKAEQERIAKEKAEQEERERIRKENEVLRKQAEEKEAALKAERERVEAERRAAEEAAAKELAAERERAEAERKALEAEQAAKLKAERDERERVEAELRKKQEEEAKAEAERKASEEKARKEAEKLAKAPVKKQLAAWVNSIELPKTEISNPTQISIAEKFEAFKSWALQQVEQI